MRGLYLTCPWVIDTSWLVLDATDRKRTIADLKIELVFLTRLIHSMTKCAREKTLFCYNTLAHGQQNVDRWRAVRWTDFTTRRMLVVRAPGVDWRCLITVCTHLIEDVTGGRGELYKVFGVFMPVFLPWGLMMHIFFKLTIDCSDIGGDSIFRLMYNLVLLGTGVFFWRL